MKFLRYLVGFPLAVIVTSLLFLLMYHLIRQEQLPPIIDDFFPPTFKPVIDDSMPPEPEPPKPEPLPDPPKPPSTKGDPIPGPKPIDERPEREGVDGLPGRPESGGGGGVVITPTGFYPVVRVTPFYPASCAARAVEGQVTVEFDVTNGGDVINARVVTSTDSCLESAALKAIAKWKYSPRLDADPDLIQKEGMRQTFEFELED